MREYKGLAICQMAYSCGCLALQAGGELPRTPRLGRWVNGGIWIGPSGDKQLMGVGGS
jgi:hypothetical protein